VSSGTLVVAIHGLEAYGRHGVHGAERELGQRFVIDVEIELVHAVATESDTLGDTIDYAALADAVVRIVGGPSVRLIERLAGLIADRVLEEPGARAVTVRVRKPHVALRHPVQDAAVLLRRVSPGPGAV
jgi:dihydroneopterin aldolase